MNTIKKHLLNWQSSNIFLYSLWLYKDFDIQQMFIQSKKNVDFIQITSSLHFLHFNLSIIFISRRSDREHICKDFHMIKFSLHLKQNRKIICHEYIVRTHFFVLIHHFISLFETKQNSWEVFCFIPNSNSIDSIEINYIPL